MGLEEEAGQFVGPEVLGRLPGEDEVDRPVGDGIHVIGGVDDPVDVWREVVGLGLERLDADVPVDRTRRTPRTSRSTTARWRRR